MERQIDISQNGVYKDDGNNYRPLSSSAIWHTLPRRRAVWGASLLDEQDVVIVEVSLFLFEHNVRV